MHDIFPDFQIGNFKPSFKLGGVKLEISCEFQFHLPHEDLNCEPLTKDVVT